VFASAAAVYAIGKYTRISLQNISFHFLHTVLALFPANLTVTLWYCRRSLVHTNVRCVAAVRERFYTCRRLMSSSMLMSYPDGWGTRKQKVSSEHSKGPPSQQTIKYEIVSTCRHVHVCEEHIQYCGTLARHTLRLGVCLFSFFLFCALCVMHVAELFGSRTWFDTCWGFANNIMSFLLCFKCGNFTKDDTYTTPYYCASFDTSIALVLHLFGTTLALASIVLVSIRLKH
jgi:hypothetical protein